jgi:hypothetical protein
MIEELRVAVERVALCPEEVQRIAAAALLVRVSQDAIRRRVSAQMSERLSPQSLAVVSREPRKARALAKVQ